MNEPEKNKPRIMTDDARAVIDKTKEMLMQYVNSPKDKQSELLDPLNSQWDEFKATLENMKERRIKIEAGINPDAD